MSMPLSSPAFEARSTLAATGRHDSGNLRIEGLGLSSSIVPTSLGPIPTVLHGAPAAASIAAHVQKEPAAPVVGALPNPAQIVRSQ